MFFGHLAILLLLAGEHPLILLRNISNNNHHRVHSFLKAKDALRPSVSSTGINAGAG
jgi:hypothetical protein